jgi:hypothetical protein
MIAYPFFIIHRNRFSGTRAWYDWCVVAFYLPGNVPVYAFSLLLFLGAGIGLAWMAWQAPAEQMLHQVEAGMWVLFGALLGSRVAYVAAHWAYFSHNTWEIPQLYLGGLAWPGALAGGMFAVALVAGAKRISPGVLADSLLPLVAAVSVSVWLSCWLDGCAYGPPILDWWGVPGIDEWGNLSSRLPVQLAGALLTLGLFWRLEYSPKEPELSPRGPKKHRRQRRAPAGVRASLGLFGLGLILLGAGLLRADPGLFWNGLRLDVWAALFFAGMAFILLLLFILPRLRSIRWLSQFVHRIPISQRQHSNQL